MASKWCEGWESHSNATQLQRKYAQSNGTPPIAAGRLTGSSTGIPANYLLVTESLGVSNTWILGFGFFVASNQAQLSTDAQGFYLERGSSEQVHLEFETNASALKVKLYRGATLLNETGFDFALNSWHYFELKITTDPSSGLYELRQGGITQFSDAGPVNTADSGSAGADILALRWSDNFSTNVRIDDLYLCDDSGTTNNDFLGPGVVRVFEVNANGDTNDWVNDNTGVSDSNNFDQVDDAGNTFPDDSGAGGTVSSNTVGEKELYDMVDLSGVTGNVHFVMLSIQAALDEAGSRQAKFKFKDSVSGEADGDTFTVDMASFDEFHDLFDVNPATASGWTISELNNGQVGMEVVS